MSLVIIKLLRILFVLGLPLFAADFSGERAFDFTRKAVAFGARPSGSPAIIKTQAWIVAELKKLRCKVTEDAFMAQTPKGLLPMKNILATFPGSSGRSIVISGHYDTKLLKDFVGANDGGSSTGFLLELGQTLNLKPRKHTVILVFFDGEEAVGDWTATDSLYGSRHLAAKWLADGTIRQIHAMINVDMIGDQQLDLLKNPNGSQTLTRLVWQIAAERGYAANFLNSSLAIDDDHMPFVDQGVNAIDLIDFNYGPNHSHWHTAADTMDKLSPRSFKVIGEVVVETIKRLEQ